MSTFSLAIYTVRVRPKRSAGSLPIHQFAPGRDLLEIVSAYISSLRVRISHDVKQRKLIRVTSVSREKGARSIDGIIETGEYGYEADLYDVSAEKISYNKTVNEAEMIPFYFLFSLPAGVDEGILILQRFKNFGIRKVLLDDFERHFRSLNLDFVVDFSPLVPEAVVRGWVRDGKIRTVKLVSFKLSSDLAKAFDIKNHEEVYSELVVRVKHKGSNAFSGLANRFLGRRGQQRLIELRETKYDYDDLKLEVDLGNGHRTVNVTRGGNPRAIYDITDGVVVEKSGHPSFESIRQQALTLLRDASEGLLHRE